MSRIDAWLSARKQRRLRAEIFYLPAPAPLRIVRFILNEGPGPSSLGFVKPDGPLQRILNDIGESLGVPISSHLVGERELKVYSQDEIIVIKPAARRFWLRVCGLDDADAVIAESFAGNRP